MEIFIIIVIAIIVYLWRDNKKVAVALAVESDPVERIKKQTGIGMGWIIIIVLVVWLVLGGAVGFSNLNLGYNDDGSFTLTEPADPNNPFARPIGEVLGYSQDAQGHWTH